MTWTKHTPVAAGHAQGTRADLTGRCVDLIEEFVFNYLRHQAVNGFYGCLAAGGQKEVIRDHKGQEKMFVQKWRHACLVWPWPACLQICGRVCPSPAWSFLCPAGPLTAPASPTGQTPGPWCSPSSVPRTNTCESRTISQQKVFASVSFLFVSFFFGGATEICRMVTNLPNEQQEHSGQWNVCLRRAGVFKGKGN